MRASAAAVVHPSLGGCEAGSFPSIHFTTRDGEADTDEDSDSTESDDSGPAPVATPAGRGKPIPARRASQELEHDLFDVTERKDFGDGLRTPMQHLTVIRTMYIQMEFVERQTLKEVCMFLYLLMGTVADTWALF